MPFASPGDLPDPGSNPHLLHWQAGSLATREAPLMEHSLSGNILLIDIWIAPRFGCSYSHQSFCGNMCSLLFGKCLGVELLDRRVDVWLCKDLPERFCPGHATCMPTAMSEIPHPPPRAPHPPRHWLFSVSLILTILVGV